MKPKIKVDAIHLEVTYDIEGDKVSLYLDTYEVTCLKFSIFDKEQDKQTGETSVEFESIEELEEILKDFKSKFNSLKKK